MKFSIKDWFFLFLAVLLGGLGILEGIESTLGIIFVAIGSMGILVILCHKFLDLWRNYGKYEKVTKKQTAVKQNQVGINGKPQKNYMSGKELMAYWNIEGFELFNCLKKGLQPYTQYGQKIIDTDTLKHGRDHSVELYEKLIRGTQETGTVFGAGANVAHRLTNHEIKQQAKKTFEGQRLKPINPPPHHMSFTFPDDNKKAAATIIKMMVLRFRKDEASEFAEKYKYRRITNHLSPTIKVMRLS